MPRFIYCTIVMVVAFTCNSFACNRVSVKDYGAVGNGIVDDTKAVQAAIDANKNIFFPKGEYLISTTLVVPASRSLYGDNGVIKANRSITMMRVEKGKVDIEHLTFDGAGKAVHGIAMASSSKALNVSNCVFHGFYGTEKDQANGIYCSSGSRRFTVSQCEFYDIDAPKNGKIGDVYGSCQGILVMKVTRGLIESCIFRDIKSVEDGDCIQVFSGRNSSNVWDDSPVIIKNCSFPNIWHRAIKLQASKCHVEGCNVSADSTRKPSAAIEVFGNHCCVKSTVVNLDYGVHALTVSGNDFELKNCDFSVDVERRHSAELTKLHSDVVYCVGERCLFTGNTFKGGYIGLYAPKAKTGLVIRNNHFKASLVRNIRLYDSTSSDMVVEWNTFEGNRVPIDMTGGQRIKIVKNKMSEPASYIHVLEESFQGTAAGNRVEAGEEVPVRLKSE